MRDAMNSFDLRLAAYPSHREWLLTVRDDSVQLGPRDLRMGAKIPGPGLQLTKDGRLGWADADNKPIPHKYRGVRRVKLHHAHQVSWAYTEPPQLTVRDLDTWPRRTWRRIRWALRRHRKHRLMANDHD